MYAVCLQSQPSCHASLKFAGYSNLLNGDVFKMSRDWDTGCAIFLSKFDIEDGVKLVGIVALSDFTKDYLIKQKIIPNNI